MKRLFPLVVLLAACGGKSTDDSGSAVADTTFTALNEDIFVKSCALSTCHLPGEEGADESEFTIDPADPQANYDAMVNATAATGNTLVVPGDIDGSFLVTKILAEQAAGDGDPMPPPFGLDAESAARVVTWVEDGAQNN